MVAINNILAASMLAASAVATTTCTEGAKASSTHKATTKSTSTPSTPEPITIFSIRSGSPIMYAPLNAIGGQFFLGGSPSAYCPPTIAAQHACPSGNYTVLEIGSTGTASLDVVVPGGQQIYIAKTGQLSYTSPHSAFIPSGAVTTGFKIGKPASNTLQEVTAVKGFLACPKNSKGDATSAPYQVFVDVKGFTDKQAPSGKKADCLGFGAYGSKYTAESAGAWEY